MVKLVTDGRSALASVAFYGEAPASWRQIYTEMDFLGGNKRLQRMVVEGWIEHNVDWAYERVRDDWWELEYESVHPTGEESAIGSLGEIAAASTKNEQLADGYRRSFTHEELLERDAVFVVRVEYVEKGSCLVSYSIKKVKAGGRHPYSYSAQSRRMLLENVADFMNDGIFDPEAWRKT